MEFTLLIIIIVLALIFDYINGFHDAANAIATVVATKVLSPFQAVVWAAFFNFLAYWVFGFGVADTVAKTASTMDINLVVILAGVIAAICWNLLTWWLGIPSSSSHTLIGGFAGAAIAHAGFGVVTWFKEGKDGGLPSGVLIVIAFIVLAPLLGALISYLISIWLLNSSKKSVYPKIFTLAIMAITVWFVEKQMKYYADIERGSCGMLLETMIAFPMYYVFLLIISSMVKSSRNIWRTVSTARKISHGLPW